MGEVIKSDFLIIDRINGVVISEWPDWGLDHVAEENRDLCEETENRSINLILIMY